jgi:hypothetical protein
MHTLGLHRRFPFGRKIRPDILVHDCNEGAMIEVPFRALLVAFVGAWPLLTSDVLAALVAAVAVSAIAVRADKKTAWQPGPRQTHCRRTASP